MALFARASGIVPMNVSCAVKTMSMYHEQLEYTQGFNQRGYTTVVWHCACGRKGAGSRTGAEARAGWIKHARGRALKSAVDGW